MGTPSPSEARGAALRGLGAGLTALLPKGNLTKVPTCISLRNLSTILRFYAWPLALLLPCISLLPTGDGFFLTIQSRNQSPPPLILYPLRFLQALISENPSQPLRVPQANDAINAPFPDPSLVSAIPPRRMGHFSAPRASYWRPTPGSYTPACRFCHGWKPSVCQGPWDRDCRRA